MTITIQPPAPVLIAVSRLAKSPSNARKTVSAIGMDELKASLLAHGLMQNLVVTDAGDGTFHVIAGARRLEAICSLQDEGKLPEDFAVPCQLATDEHALEMSMAENMVRLAMHPADQFEAFAELIDAGHSAADIAPRFGVEESLVLKRLKLARVAPELLAEYRADGMTLECLMAFTVTDDHRRQRKVFKSLPDWQKDDPASIRAALTEKMVEASGKLARFVGLDAYRESGGITRSDLFGDEIYLEKPTLLNRLAVQKLEAIRSELAAEGWGWIDINPDRDYETINRCGRIQPRLIDAPPELLSLKTKLDDELAELDCDDDAQIESLESQLSEVEEQLTAYVGFDDTQKHLAGCFVSIGQDGTAFIDKGLVKPEQRKALATLLGEEPNRKAKAKVASTFPETLRKDLAAVRLPMVQAITAQHPEIALDLLAFTVAYRLLGNCRCDTAISIEFKPSRRMPPDNVPADGDPLAEVARSLDTSWLKQETEADCFRAFLELPNTARSAILAYCVALTLQPRLSAESAADAGACDIALAMTGTDIATHWRPTAANFFNRVSREQLLAIARATLGDAWADARMGDTKSTLASELDRAFSNPKAYGRTEQQVAALQSWLPSGMAVKLPLNAAGSGSVRQAA